MIYSTYIYNTRENEENTRWIRNEFGVEVLLLNVAEGWNITNSLLSGEHFPVHRFLPYKIKGEGFSMAVLRKPSVNSRKVWDGRSSVQGKASVTSGVKGESVKKKGRKPQGKGVKIPGPSKEQLSVFRNWTSASDEYEFIQNDDSTGASPKYYLPELPALQSSLCIVQARIRVIEQKGEDWTPNHALATSRILGPDVSPREKVSYGQTITYLWKEVVTLSGAAPCGVALLTYKDISLGLVKNIGNRANDLYPQEWRICSGYLPEKAGRISD